MEINKIKCCNSWECIDGCKYSNCGKPEEHKPEIRCYGCGVLQDYHGYCMCCKADKNAKILKSNLL